MFTTQMREMFFDGTFVKKGLFTVSSIYRNLIQQGVVPDKSPLWKLKIPLKIKIFLWYLKKGVILTKDNLAKRKRQGSVKYCFCSSDETIQHLFLDCHFASFVWNTIESPSLVLVINDTKLLIHMLSGLS
jgi:hypothetical protein